MDRPGRTVRLAISRWSDQGLKLRTGRDTVATEEPLEIRLREAGQVHFSLAVTMRTPGNDFELVAGFLFTEGVLDDPSPIAQMTYCSDDQDYNIVTVDLRAGVAVDPARFTRNVYTTSSCGVCGKTSIDLVTARVPERPQSRPVSGALLATLPQELARAQKVFSQTGGLHASGLFDLEGKLLVLREDVGRHNATDKVVGRLFLDDKLPAEDTILLLSGRASFELLQKAILAGVATVAALGAPSSLAVELAQSAGVTLVGFLKGDRFNVYSGSERLI